MDGLPLVVARIGSHTEWNALSDELRELPLETITIGFSDEPLPDESGPALSELTLTLGPDGPGTLAIAGHLADVDLIEATVRNAPRAAVTLCRLLRLTTAVEVPDALVVESYAYSMLLAGPEFHAWLDNRRRRRPPPRGDDAVVVSRTGEVLTVTLNRPSRHNSLTAQVRDEMYDALALARLDPSITAVELRANGPSFCSGGDLDEFGTAPDVVTAQRTRMERHVGGALAAAGATTTAYVHGACIGAGCEIPAFADRVVAAPDAFFSLPELAMGLVPGAGGTVSVPQRIGRWRTAYLALTGRRINAEAALDWGLVDELHCAD